MRHFPTASMLFVVAALAPAIAFGQQPATRAEIASAFVGRTATFAGFSGVVSSQSKFGTNGSYTYMYRSDYTAETYTGRYAIYDGKICIAYTGGSTGTACYAVLKDKDGGFLWETNGWGVVSVTFEK